MNHTYGQLPTVVSHDNRVSDFQCRLYAEIASLSNKYGYCFASNDYLGKTFSKSPETISRAISGLQKLGYLTVIIEDGYKRKMKVKMDFSDMEPIDENVKGGCQKDQGGLTKMSRGVDENVMTANNIIQLDKSNEINRRIVETSSTVTLIDEIDETSVEIHHVPDYFSDYAERLESIPLKATQKKERKSVAPKKKESDNPTPIKPMFDIYSEYYQVLTGEPPVWQTKYAPALKKLYEILTARCAQKGIIQLDHLQPWRDFLDAWAVYLNKNEKEKWQRDNFNPATFYGQFNTIVAKLKNQPKTTEQKWEQFYRENTTG